MGEFLGTGDHMALYFNQMFRALNAIGDDQKAMTDDMKTLSTNQKTLADNQNSIADDVTPSSLVSQSKRPAAVLKCMAAEFETAHLACGLAAKIYDILDRRIQPEVCQSLSSVGQAIQDFLTLIKRMHDEIRCLIFLLIQCSEAIHYC
jgi:hypothetical protein